ncbi:MAG: dystroglycan-type cadherin-like domain repeat protein, partial [Planctomycetota bacterium]|nr:dystroglycan-type cadherin-like domain repeat protein [Planctomycetota bacterium]
TDFNNRTAQILVSSNSTGGTLSAVGTTFTGTGGYTANISVGAAGHFSAANSTFAITGLYLDNASIYGAGDLTGDNFGMPIYVPYNDVKNLANNARFTDININAGTIGTGALALNAIGTNTASLRYVFPGNFTVGAGATVSVAPNLPVQILAGATLTVNGTLSFGLGDVITFSPAPSSASIAVGNGGLLSASGVAFNTDNTSYTTQVSVNSGGKLVLSSSTYNLSNLNLNSGSNDTLGSVVFKGVMTINSAATLSVAQNDFSGLGANGIVAVGDSQATINLKNNYWGTSVTSVIDTKILDHIDSAATRPTVVYAPIVKGTSGITAASVSTTFSYAAQDVTLTAIVTDAAANRINEGTVTFNVLSGSTPIGASATSNTVANGIASATYHLPASTLVGGYTIQAIYNDDSALGNYLSVTDAAHTLTVAKVTAPSVAIDSNRSIIYSDISNQTVHLIATVTSAAGVVNEGSITFNIRSGGTTIGQIVPNVPVAVVGGVGTATADYVLPLGTPGGLFTIEADYSGSSNLNPATDISKTLHISQADTTTTPSSATTTYSINTQNVTLTSSVTSLAGTINEGTVTFNVYKLDGLTILGTTTSSRVDNGLATAHFSLDAKTPKGSYSIVAMYNGTNNYAPSIDDPPTLTVDPAPSSTSASNVTATFNPIDQTVSVRADITSGVDLVSEGSVVFTLLKGTTPIVTSGPIAVTSGVASTILTLTGGTSADTYTVRAAYSGSNYVASTSDGTLALGQKTPTITWADPSDIVYGTPLSGTQLNAKASVAGGISYSSPVGTILGVGSTQALTASFTPTDTTNYKVAATTVHINVLKANPVFSLLTASQSIVYGQAAIGVSGKLAATTAVPFNDSLTITIGSASGTALVQADGTFSTSIDTHAISASATSYTVNYSFAGDGNFVATNDVTTSLTVARATPPITWADPSDIVFGTLLSGTQLNASTSVAGSFSYSPAVGARPNAGNGQILSATFTPTDTTNYLTVPGTVHLNVLRAQPIFSLLTASQSIAYGKSSIDVTGKLAATSAIPAGQLVTIAVGSTTASVMVQADGTFSATIDTHALNASATPYPITYGYSATTNFQLAGDATTTLTVTKVGQTITLNDLPAAAAYGTIIHTKPTSTSGLPIILAPTNCTVKSTADGGFDITIGSGTNAAIVVATQSGDGNTNPAESVIVTITAQKAAATVTLSGTSATYDGSPHFASTTTTPIGRTVNLAYDQGGVPVTSPTAAGSYHVTATISDADYAGTASATLTIARATPVLNWSNPAAITFGTALSSTQLNASSSVPGSFVYNPVSGTRPNTGNNQTLSATFTPTDTVNYNSTSATATINVVQAQPIFSQLTASQAITYGMSSISVAGKLAAGAVVPAAQTVTITLNGVATTATVQSDGTFGATLDTSALNASATPYTITYGFATTTNFLAAANGSTTVTVGKATQTVSFLSVPTGGVFGTTVIARPVSSSGLPIILTPTNCSFVSRADGGYDVTLNGGAGTATLVATAQVNSNYLNATPVTATIVVTKATASVSLTGLSAVYNGSVHLAGATTTPANLVVVVGYKQGGVVVASPTNAGAYDVTATVNDPNYQGTATDTLAIGKATPILTWSSPSDVPFGTPLSTTVQLNATANVPGNLDYGSQPGMVLGLGSHPLTASFTPLDTTNYSSQPVTTTINVTPAHPVFSGLTASQTITSGKPTIDVAGKLAATPPEIPAGNTVTITVGASQKTATIQADGTFSATLDTSALNASATAYAITYSYAATTSFLAATDTSTKLTVGKASQAVSFLIAPPSGVYGTKVIVRPTSTSGLPIILTPTNCSLTPRADGGYDVTLDGGVGTATVTAASSADINHLDAPQVTATIAVTKATASVSLNGLSAVYNGSVHVAGATTTPAGLAVNLVYKQGGVVVASPTNAGAYDVTATVNDPNYQGAATDTLVIARATPILAWSPPGDIVLGTALSDSQLDATSLVAGTFDYGSQGGTVLGTGGHVLSVSFTPSDLGNYVKTGASTTLNVTPAHPVFSQLTASQTITYGKPTIGIAGKLAATPPEIPAGDTVTITVGSSQMTATVQADGTFSATIDTHALAASATPYTISYSSAAGASFLAASDTSTRLTVGKAHLTVIPADQAKTYDGAALTGFASTFSGFVNGETFLSSGITGQPGFGGPAVGAVNVGSYDASINSVAALSAANYDFSASAVTAHLLITIASAAVTVDPSSLSQTYDGSIKTVKATTTPAGLALKSVFTQNGVAATPAQAGTYLVTETINDPNYQGTQTATLTIARASQAITITGAPAGAAFNQTFNVRPTSTSGLPVLLTGTNCRVVGLADGSYDVTMTSGTAAATLTASQAGDANFNAAAPRTVTISAQKAPATVTLSGLTFAFDGSAHSASATTSPAGLAVTFAYAQGGVAVAKPNGAGDYAVTATINDLNYEGGQTGTLTISKPSAPPQATGASAAHIKKNVSSITITFDMDLKASSATNPGAFSVFGVVKKGKKTTLKSLGIGTPIYNASAHSVTLTLAKSYKGAVKVTVLKGIMAATGATSQADMPFTVN